MKQKTFVKKKKKVLFFFSFCSSDSFLEKVDEIQASDGISITQEFKYP